MPPRRANEHVLGVQGTTCSELNVNGTDRVGWNGTNQSIKNGVGDPNIREMGTAHPDLGDWGDVAMRGMGYAWSDWKDTSYHLPLSHDSGSLSH